MFSMYRPLAILAALGLAVTFGMQAAMSAPDAGAKARGEFNFYGRAAGHSMRGARESARSYRTYAKAVPAATVAPHVAKATTDAIGASIEKTESHLAWIKKEAIAGDDKETLASLDSIDKHLAAARKHHSALCACCEKESIESKASMECCKGVDAALTEAITEHEALMKRLEGDTPGEHDHSAQHKHAEQLAKLSPVDRALAGKQKTCPVTDEPLGSMGVPTKVTIKGRAVLLCCKACEKELLADAETYLAKLPKE